MTTQEAPAHQPRKPFTYDTFIEELRPLHAQTGAFAIKEQNTTSSAFLRWKLRLTDLINQTERLGYSVRCDVAQRPFASMYGSGSDKVWVSHMVETRHELELIIENYEKYGTPEPVRKGKTSFFGTSPPPVPETLASVQTTPAPTEPKALPPPEKVTILWLVTHVDVVKGWVPIFTLFGLTFSAGMWFDTTILHPERTVVQTPSASPAAAALPAAKPASK